MNTDFHRQSIQQGYCSCWDIITTTINGIPYNIDINRLSLEELEDFIHTFNNLTTLAVDIKNTNKHVLDAVLTNQLPLIVSSQSVLPKNVITRLSDVPHSGIIITLDDCLERHSDEELFLLQQTLNNAKELGVFSSIRIPYRPHEFGTLSVHRALVKVKNFVQHVTVFIDDIEDSQRELSREVLDIKSFYNPNVSDRSWTMNSTWIDKICTYMEKYVSSYKVSLNIEQHNELCGTHMKYNNTRNYKEPLGIKAFQFEKQDTGQFQEVKTGPNKVLFNVCPRCGQLVF